MFSERTTKWYAHWLMKNKKFSNTLLLISLLHCYDTKKDKLINSTCLFYNYSFKYFTLPNYLMSSLEPFNKSSNDL